MITKGRSAGLEIDWLAGVVSGGSVWALGAAFYTVLYILWFVFQWGGETYATLIGNVAFVPVNLVAIVLSLRVAALPMADTRTRQTWLLFGLAYTAYLCGNLLYSAYDVIFDTPPFPSWADLGYALFYPLMLAGLLLSSVELRRDAQLTFWLDALTVLLGSGLVLWHFVLRPTAVATYSSRWETVFSLMYPVGSTVLLLGVATNLLRIGQHRLVSLFMLLNLLLFIGGDLGYGYLYLQDSYEGGSWPDLLYMLALLAMVFGAQTKYHRLVHPSAPPTAVSTTPSISLLPYLSVGLGYGMLLIVAHNILTTPLGNLIVGAMLLTGLVVARQIVAVRDNARLLAQQAAYRSEARFRTLVQHASDVIIVLREDGVIQYQSPSAERMFGPITPTLTGTLLTNLLHPEDIVSFHRFLHTVTQHAAATPVEWRVRHPEGGWSVVETLAVNLLNDPDISGIVLTMRDITERKKVDQLKNEFVSVVSHELRTPLTSIRGSLGLLAGDVAGTLPPQAKLMIDIAHKNSERLVRLINDILDIEKIESGKIIFSFTPLHVLPLVEQAINDNQGYAQQFGVDVVLEPSDPDVAVIADNDRFLQVMTNLLSNAAKFSPIGGVVRVAARRHSYGVRVSVTDHGTGIPEEFRTHIFQKFAQADSTDTRLKEGTGLGLSITKAIVEKFGGRIGFASEVGKGTTFYVDLPEWRGNEEVLVALRG